jgi:hypothetical protein
MLQIRQLFRSIPRHFYTTSTIPFDKKPFSFSRFEPCCPDANAKQADNGFVPCQQHPIPAVLGKKIDMTDNMIRPSSLRHLVGSIGYDALEWTRSKVESVPGGIMQIMMTTENYWLRNHRSSTSREDKQILSTVSDRPPMDGQRPDILMFPEFKLIPSVETINGHLPENSILYKVLDSMWRNPQKSIDSNMEGLKDIQADTVVLVCTHGRRDLRCGRLGPLIVDEFRRLIKQNGLEKKVEVWGTSHFGGKSIEKRIHPVLTLLSI